ncbi:hypothetical protein [Candidatus Aquarickettsia rohweri]|uniref:Uncharacterized protein n=1 Tax=Candidatus Aquarickettsia rohweri TaxID=2602574 RepID=A0A3R9XKC6_9RICK|nr:hypothetical protein [Candidatus Aquarickettsia rohweri]RST62524.1 hypothetical protein EIC27_06205 [Candidatus Aquarickettsia rohweri]
MNNYNKNLLDIVKVELLSRKTSSIDEVLKIIYLTKKLLKKSNINFYDIFEQVIRELHQDIVKTIELNEYIYNYSNKLAPLTYPLKYNKNFELLAGALEFCKNYTHYIFSDELVSDLEDEKKSFTRILFKGLDSYLNYIKIFYYSILNLVLKKDLFAFCNENKVLNLDYSANIQSTILPKNLDVDKLNFNIFEWKYFYKDEFSPSQGELLYFTNGYTFGGSSENVRYKLKKFRDEDCLTSILKWIGAEEDFDPTILPSFSTLDIEKYFDSYNNSQKSKFQDILSKYMIPISNFSEAKVGDIFAYREYDIQSEPLKRNYKHSISGHIGVISEIVNSVSFENISYSRHIPEVEGLVSSLENLKSYPHKKYMFFGLKNYM